MRTIKLEAQRSGQTKRIKGVEFHVALSPYFFPERLECQYQEESGCFVIDLKYLDEEQGTVLDAPGDDLASLVLGHHTGKLLSVRIHVDRHNVNQIRMTVTDDAVKAIEHAKRERPEMRPHYEAAEDALREHRDEIAAAVVA